MTDEYTPTTEQVEARATSQNVFGRPLTPEQFRAWLAAHDAQVRREAKTEALREAARLTRFLWTGTTNLPDLDDAEVGYSFDRWLEVYADRIEREGGEGQALVARWMTDR